MTLSLLDHKIDLKELDCPLIYANVFRNLKISKSCFQLFNSFCTKCDENRFLIFLKHSYTNIFFKNLKHVLLFLNFCETENKINLKKKKKTRYNKNNLIFFAVEWSIGQKRQSGGAESEYRVFHIFLSFYHENCCLFHAKTPSFSIHPPSSIQQVGICPYANSILDVIHA